MDQTIRSTAEFGKRESDRELWAAECRGPTVLDRDRSNKPRGRTRTEDLEGLGTMALESRIKPQK